MLWELHNLRLQTWWVVGPAPMNSFHIQKCGRDGNPSLTSEYEVPTWFGVQLKLDFISITALSPE